MQEETKVALKRLSELHTKRVAEEKLAQKNFDDAEKKLIEAKRLTSEVFGVMQQLMAETNESAAEVRTAPEWQKRAEKVVNQVETLSSFPMESLEGLTQTQCIVVIAKHFNGFVKTQDVRLILTKAGKMKNSQNVDSMIYQLINNSDRFERVSHGLYRLKNYKPPSESSDDRTSSHLQ